MKTLLLNKLILNCRLMNIYISMFLPELVTEECCICSFKSRDSHTKPFHCPTWLCMCWASLAVKYVGVSKSIMAFPFSFSYFSLYFTWGSKQKCQVNCCGKSGFNQFAKTGSQYGYLSLFLLVKYIYNTYKAAKSLSLCQKRHSIKSTFYISVHG